MMKNCDFCHGAKYISGTFSASGPMPNSDGSFCHQIDGDVDYCPMCGRKIGQSDLRVPSKDEWMERYCTPKQYVGYKKREENNNDSTTV